MLENAWICLLSPGTSMLRWAAHTCHFCLLAADHVPRHATMQVHAQTDCLLMSVCLQLVCWAELVLIQLATPEASFLGHLCGILAGVVHLHLP